MKKFARKSLAVLLVVIMTASICCSFVTVSAATISGDVSYNKSGSFQYMSFNPSNGYIAVPYSADGESRTLIESLLDWGAYEYCGLGGATNTATPGMINAAYFDMNSGLLNGSNMTNGKIIVWSEPWQFTKNGSYYEPLIVFKSDGTIDCVDSNMDVAAHVEGALDCNISYINKYPDTVYADVLHYFDKNNYYGTSFSGMPSGDYIVVEKDNEYVNLGLNVPVTGKVVRIGTGTGTSFEADQFVLYFKGSTSYFSNVQVGDFVSVTAKETMEDAKAVMTDDVIGFVQSTGWLIKDGVDHTDLYSYIGPGPLNNSTNGHSVTLSRGWTGMGVTSGGGVVLMTSTGQSTMASMANAMLSLGVVNAWRMDSGGSTQMVAGGSVYRSEGEARYLPEGIMIVNTAYMANSGEYTSSAVKTELGRLISEAEAILGSASSVEELVEAKAAYAGTIQADQRRAIAKLLQILSAKGLLGALVDSAKAVDVNTLTDYKADLLQTAILEGERLVNSNATDAQFEEFTAKLSEYMNGTFGGDRVSLGAAYKTGKVNASYPDTDGSELTNGDLYETTLSNSSDRWVGFHKDNASGTNTKGSYAQVYIDLGEKTAISGASVSARNYTAWGISAPKAVEVLVSDDGTNFKKYLTLENSFDAIDGVDQTMFYHGAKSVQARYVTFRAYFADGSSHLFLGETSVYSNSTSIDYITADVFNTYVDGTNVTTIFTTAFASSLTSSNANLDWCDVAVCEYDSEAGAYVVTAFNQNRGSTTAVTIPSNGFVVAFYAEAGWELSANIQVGDYVFINGTHLSAEAFDAMARITFRTIEDDIVIGDVNITVETIVSAGNGVASPDDDFVRLIGGTITVNQLIAVSNDKNITVTVNGVVVTGNTKIGNGAVITDSTGMSYIAYVGADANGDNKVTPLDYITMKRAFMGTKDLDGLQLKAACISGGDSVGAIDYIMLKRYFLGTYELK